MSTDIQQGSQPTPQAACPLLTFHLFSFYNSLTIGYGERERDGRRRRDVSDDPHIMRIVRESVWSLHQHYPGPSLSPSSSSFDGHITTKSPLKSSVQKPPLISLTAARPSQAPPSHGEFAAAAAACFPLKPFQEDPLYNNATPPQQEPQIVFSSLSLSVFQSRDWDSGQHSTIVTPLL